MAMFVVQVHVAGLQGLATKELVDTSEFPGVERGKDRRVVEVISPTPRPQLLVWSPPNSSFPYFVQPKWTAEELFDDVEIRLS
jgi:hypothetical protein